MSPYWCHQPGVLACRARARRASRSCSSVIPYSVSRSATSRCLKPLRPSSNRLILEWVARIASAAVRSRPAPGDRTILPGVPWRTVVPIVLLISHLHAQPYGRELCLAAPAGDLADQIVELTVLGPPQERGDLGRGVDERRAAG